MRLSRLVARGLRHAYLKELWIWRRALKRPSRRLELDQLLRRQAHHRRRPLLRPAHGRWSDRWDFRRRSNWMTCAASAKSIGHERSFRSSSQLRGNLHSSSVRLRPRSRQCSAHSQGGHQIKRPRRASETNLRDEGPRAHNSKAHSSLEQPYLKSVQQRESFREPTAPSLLASRGFGSFALSQKEYAVRSRARSTLEISSAQHARDLERAARSIQMATQSLHSYMLSSWLSCPADANRATLR